MPRRRTPESAAKAIIDMIESRKATDVDDAVAQRPDLRDGANFLLKATRSSHGATAPAATGSGSALLQR